MFDAFWAMRFEKPVKNVTTANRSDDVGGDSGRKCVPCSKVESGGLANGAMDRKRGGAHRPVKNGRTGPL